MVTTVRWATAGSGCQTTKVTVYVSEGYRENVEFDTRPRDT